MEWLPITLLCAFSLASSDAATKAWLRDYSARELALVRFTLAGVVLLPGLLLFPVGDPQPVFWLWMAALVPLEILAMLLYMKAIRDHPLSLTLPYLAFSPVFIVVTGWVVLGEKVGGRGFAGVLLVMAGGWLLNMEHARSKDWRTWIEPLKAILYEPGSRMMLGVALIFSLTSVMGKAAMAHTRPEAFGPFYFVLIGAVTALLFSLREPRTLIRILRRPGPAFAVGALTAVMVSTHFIALSMVEAAYMISVKRTSLLFGILYGAWLFRERGLGMHLVAGVLMVLGVYLITVGD
jgi:drug/metabolite transporter (DMT)-like permease